MVPDDPQLECLEQRGHDGEEEQGQEHEHDRAERQREGGRAQLEESARLLLVVGDVDRGHQVARSGRGAPQRRQHRDDQTDAQRAVAGVGQRVELVGDQRLGFPGQRTGQRLHLAGDGLRVGDDPVERQARDERGRDRQEREEGHTSREDADVVRGAFRERPTGHLPPAGRRDLCGCPRLPARPRRVPAVCSGGVRPIVRANRGGTRLVGGVRGSRRGRGVLRPGIGSAQPPDRADRDE